MLVNTTYLFKYLRMQSWLCVLLVLGTHCWSTPVTAQDPFLQNEVRGSDERANALMQAYQAELGMTVEQALLFRNKAEEFVIRRQRLQQMDLPVEEKVGLLQQLSDQETAEMGNVLTRTQLRAYQKLKLRLQPVAVLVEEDP